jgi:O-acetyl-ADP-ribose deacetylase (regulator of RNase III)
MKVEVLIANIATQADIEAVVNSANGNLRLGSGVAGAIHTAAGHELEVYCQQFAPLAHGKAVITPAFKLPNRWVIHTRAANYLLEDNAEDVLRQCFESVWKIAIENDIKSLALPAIGTGVFKVPLELAASTTAASLKAHQKDCVELIRICVTDAKTQTAFLDALNAVKLV